MRAFIVALVVFDGVGVARQGLDFPPSFAIAFLGQESLWPFIHER